MELSELAAIQAAYQTLQPLDAAGRRRALHWLSDALGTEQPVAVSSTVEATSAGPAAVGDAAPAARAGAGGRRAVRSRRATAAPARAEERRTRRGRQATSGTGERAYRRMPPAEEVVAAYQQVGTVSGLAEHFGVPRHTVQGWARRLRSQGYQIGRGQ